MASRSVACTAASTSCARIICSSSTRCARPAASRAPRTSCVPVMFGRMLRGFHRFLAMGETLAHLHYLWHDRRDAARTGRRRHLSVCDGLRGRCMDMSMATFWWVLAGAAVAVELATGTFYLLMIALGLAAGRDRRAPRVARRHARSWSAAIVGGGATAAWHWHRARQPAQPRRCRESRREPGHQRSRARRRLGRRRHCACAAPRLGLGRTTRARRRRRIPASTSSARSKATGSCSAPTEKL